MQFTTIWYSPPNHPVNLKESITTFMKIIESPLLSHSFICNFESYLDGISVCRQNSSKGRANGEKKEKKKSTS